MFSTFSRLRKENKKETNKTNEMELGETEKVLNKKKLKWLRRNISLLRALHSVEEKSNKLRMPSKFND